MKTNAGLAPAMVLTALALAALAGGAAAETKAERAGVMQKLIDCRKLTDSAQRLACYDAAAAALDQAEAKGDVVVVDREQAKKVRKQAFGFSLPSISLFEKGVAKEELENVDGIVAAARQDGGGHWVIRLEDGAVWAQNGVEEMFKTPRPGMKVRIKKAALGSYMMIIENQGGVKAHRVE
jgi:hypothetical protein